MNFYKRFSGDYGRKTGHLSLAEHGAYTLMMDWAYANERPLPAELESIYRICRATTREERKAVGSVLDQFWVKELAGWSNPRVEEEIAAASQRVALARVNGKKGGRPGMFDVSRGTIPGGNPEQTQAVIQTETENIPGTSAGRNRRSKLARLSDSQTLKINSVVDRLTATHPGMVDRIRFRTRRSWMSTTRR
jgi:uncharacterized protein YdaU (DUF1376 family)